MAADVTMVPATAEHGELLAANLRAVEVDEVMAATGRDPLPVIVEGIRDSSEAWAVFFDGELAFVWGVVAMPSLGEPGVGWLLSTPLVERRAKTFWRFCQATVPDVLRRWPEGLVNAIDVRHAKALRWGRRLGFRFVEPQPLGVAGELFCLFHVTLEDLCAHQPSWPS